MFEKMRKVLSILAVTMMVTSSLPLNVLADENIQPAVEATTNNEVVENKVIEPTTTTTTEEPTQPSVESNQSNVSEAIGTTENANAPNTTETVVEAPKEVVKPSVEEQLNAIGFTYKNGILQSTTGTSYRDTVDIDKAVQILKEAQGVRRVRRAVANTIWVDRNSGVNYVSFTRKGHSELGWYMKRDSDGRVLWCIEPTVPLDWDANGGFTRVEDNREVMIRASLIAYFGYEIAPSIKNAFYTEMLIGETVEGSGPTAISGGSYSLAEYNAFKTRVLAEIGTFFHKPEFANQTYTLKAGESITITDSTARLRNYILATDGGYSVTRNGNSITIHADANSSENGKIKFKYNIPRTYEGATLVYRNPYLQDVISAHVNDPTWFNVNINVLKNGKGKIVKKDEKGQPVAGAVFEVTNKSDGSKKKLTTGPNGEVEGEWQHGTVLSIKETQAPKGLVRDNLVKEITIEANQTKSVEFTNKHQKTRLIVVKEDVETGNKAQGKATLDGAVYGLFKENGEKVTEVALHNHEGKVQATIDNLDLGNYYLQELQAPKGYQLNNEKISVTLEYQGQDVEVAVASKIVTDKVIKGSIKGYKFGDKSLIDRFIDLFTGNKNIKNPLQGIEISATSYTTGKVYTAVTNAEGYFEINNLPFDKYQVTESRGKLGYRLIDPFDVEITTQGQTHTYLLEDKVIENKIKVVKVDSETGKAIARSQAQFKIYDRTTKKFLQFTVPNTDEKSEILTTNSKGYLVTSEPLLYGIDRYELHEVKAPEGYVRNTKPIVFSVDSGSNETVIEIKMTNLNQKGKVTIHKTAESAFGTRKENTPYGEITKFTFNQQAIAGVQFKIRAKADVVTNDGTVRLAKGQYVQADGQDLVLTTNAQGQVQSPALYLGSYELVEVSAPAGVVTLANSVPFELTYAGQDKELTVADTQIENPLQTIEIPVFKKQVEVVTGFKDGKAITEYQKADNQVVYALRLKQDVQVGNTLIPKGTVLDYAPAMDGRVSFSDLKLPRQVVGLEVVEVRTQHDLVLNTDKHSADYVPSNNQAKTEVPIVKENQFNRLARANVELFKYDTAYHLGRQNPIKDVPFELVGYVDGKQVVIGTYKTNADGKIKVDNLPTGSYFFREVKALDGYIAYKEMIPFNVSVETNGQTIKVSAENKRQPIEIGTKATFENGAKVLNPFKENKLVDTIKFTNLMVGKSYIWKTKIVEYGNPSNVIKEFETPFVADKMNGEFKIQTSVDGSQLRGKKITFMETLVDGEVPTHVWSEHNNPKDEGQSVRITNPEISTQATFENGLKEMNPFKESKLVDTVSYKDLVPNREYKLVTKLVEWGNPNNVIATKTESFTPKSANGEYKVHLTVDGTKLRGKKVVFLEYLYDNEKPSEEQTKHDNSKDEGQSVHFTNPSIGTKATFENGLKEMNPFKENVIVDTISYKDLVPNRKYRVVTKLVEADITLDSKGNVKEDVTKELDENVSVGAEAVHPLSTGKKTTSVSVGIQTEKAVIYESETFFTPKKKDGEYKVTIKIDGSKLRGKTLVFYEYLYDNEKPTEEQARHDNPKDEGQSVRLTNPKIGTQAYGYKGENHKLIQPLKEMTVTDKIKYEDLTIGRKYRVVTKLIEFGQPNKVIKEVESYFTPKEKDGFYYVSMKLDGLMLQGKKVTFMEYLCDNEKPSEEQAKHENPKDEGQTVEIAKPAIKTLATGSNGEKVLIGKGVQTIKEKAELTGLVVGQKYRVKVQAYFVGTTQGVAGTYAEKEFVAERSSMTFDWTFKVDVSKLGGKAISFTEILETENEEGKYEEVHRHNDDHKDKDQTIMIKQYLPKAGSRTTTAVVIVGFVLILMSVIIFAFLKSSKLD
ncbi:VaFE repeat-containing surface-anchored protein [Enterococcus cecorum]|uniref:VaFE repeat-containing surface-anchored protein n=1 Tax=Enterococcus cecorum TaxID=44008 RepID=UPI0038B28316